MELTPEQKKIEDGALVFAKENRRRIARELTRKDLYPSENNPVSVFMAGSPGAGKTEASKALIEKFDGAVLRVDPDDLREHFGAYKGDNSFLFQRGVSVLVEKVHDLALKQKQSFILDGTLSNYSKAKENIDRSLGRKRLVQLLYVYQSPERAWEFVQARELVEGRNIPLKNFIDQYFQARDTVNRLKARYGTRIKLDLLLHNYDHSKRQYKANIDRVDNHVPEKYNPATLEIALRKG